jgi:hypothetical protein
MSVADAFDVFQQSKLPVPVTYVFEDDGGKWWIAICGERVSRELGPFKTEVEAKQIERNYFQ